MAAPKLGRGYPLAWPPGRPRTRAPSSALFRDNTSSSGRVSQEVAEKRLMSQFNMMTKGRQDYRVTDIILSTNVRYTLDGRRDQNISKRDPVDVGAAVYFNLDRKPHVLACDWWNTIADNIAAIAAHVDALRGQERWGVADLAQAFSGHAALAAPDPWWQVLGVRQDAPFNVVEAAYRALARAAHPDAGGSEAAMQRLNAARDAARRARA